MQTLSDELAAKTLQYWRISQQWNGVSDSNVATDKALDIFSTIIYGTNQVRPIVRRVEILRADVIRGEGSPPQPNSSLILLASTK